MKSFTYENGSDFRTISESDIRAIIEHLDRSTEEKTNATRVLALDLDASYTTTHGTVFTRVADDTPPSRALICGGRGSARKCEVCGAKVSGHGRLCDGPGKTGRNATETCDTFMCASCAKCVVTNRDLCPTCVAKGVASA